MKRSFVACLVFALVAVGACNKPKSPPGPTPQVLAAGCVVDAAGTRAGDLLLTAVAKSATTVLAL